MARWYDNEDAGDLDMMNDADASEFFDVEYDDYDEDEYYDDEDYYDHRDERY